MKAYQSLWVTLCVPLIIIGLGVGFVFLLFPLSILVVFVGALSAMVTWRWLLQSELRQGQRRAVRVSWPITHWSGGAAAGALLGYTPPPGCGCCPRWSFWLWPPPRYAVSAYGRWLRSVPTPLVAQLDAMARALGDGSPEYLMFQPFLGEEALTTRSCVKAGGPATRCSRAPALSRADGRDRSGAADLSRRARTMQSGWVRGLARVWRWGAGNSFLT